MLRIVLSLVVLLGGCASKQHSDTVRQPRLFALHEQPLPRDARSFAMGAVGAPVYRERSGSWMEPLEVRGLVLDAGRGGRTDAVRVKAPGWVGHHRIVLGSGSDRIVLRYDTPAAPAPIQPGQIVRLFAHTMSIDGELAYAMRIHADDGTLRMAAIRSPAAPHGLLPPGWAIGYGRPVRSVCDGAVHEHAVRVRGPGGEAYVSPGWTSVAPLGPAGERYAIDVTAARTVEGRCGKAQPGEGLSVVIRRAEAHPPSDDRPAKGSTLARSEVK